MRCLRISASRPTGEGRNRQLILRTVCCCRWDQVGIKGSYCDCLAVEADTGREPHSTHSADPPAGSFFGGFRTPAQLPLPPLAPGRHPKPARKAVVPAPRLTAALVKRLQTEPQLRSRYFCLAYHQDSAPSFCLSTSSAEQLEASGMRKAAGRRPGAHRRSIVIGSASRRSTIRTAANWILPDGWGG